jgi:hypothetical protein
LWLLKNSLSTQNSSKLGDAKCLGIRKRRLNRIVMQSYFRQFLEKEFFNSHGLSPIGLVMRRQLSQFH